MQINTYKCIHTHLNTYHVYIHSRIYMNAHINAQTYKYTSITYTYTHIEAYANIQIHTAS